MKLALILLVVVPACSAPAVVAQLAGFPFTNESLAYTVSWPSGLNLGEGHLTAKNTAPAGSPAAWSLELTLDAAIPAFAVKDQYTSHANADFCSADFSRHMAHGPKKGGESETVDRSHETVTRETLNGGGKSEFAVPDCVKDALTLLFYTRKELGQGRVPPAQTILFGGLYDARLDYVGAQNIQVGGKPQISDKIVCSLKGPASSMQFEIWFARDPARTPLLITVPLAIGKFSMELVR